MQEQPIDLLTRIKAVIASYKTAAPEIKISLFDNGEIDGDIVTVYHNGNKIIDKQLLGTKAISYTVIADANTRKHEFTLVAENLGTIEPNTAFMKIIAGGKIYELTASTSLKQNASIIIEYTGN